MKKLTIISAVLLSLVSVLPLRAQDNAKSPLPPPLSPQTAYQQVITISELPIVVPTVVEVPLPERLLKSERFLVREAETDTYLGSYLKETVQYDVPRLEAETSIPTQNSQWLVDSELDTYVEFPVNDNVDLNEVEIAVNASRPITTSRLTLRLSEYVALPKTVEIRVGGIGGETKTIVARKGVTSPTITFPEVTASRFEIKLSYGQPLRITELDLAHAEVKDDQQYLRFLAQPQRSYQVFYQSDRAVFVETAESGDLRNNEGVLRLPKVSSLGNSQYKPADTDGDGVIDILDNCVQVKNSDQLDIDDNRRGDACDDWDRDGWLNYKDNCPDQPNANQLDTDSDEIGDVCDGEESRFTERNAWVPWVGMGVAGLVLLVLFWLVAKGPKPRLNSSIDNSDRQ